MDKKALLSQLEKKGYLRDDNVKQVMLEVDRSKFTKIPEQKKKAWDDTPIVFFYENDEHFRTISAPHMVAIMLQLLDLRASDTVLILGSKGGYIASLISLLCPKGHVYLLEADPPIARATSENLLITGFETRVTVINRDPLLGLPEKAPWSKILITGAIPFVPKELLNQLVEGGFVLTPISSTSREEQEFTEIIRHGNDFQTIPHGKVIFQELSTECLTPAACDLQAEPLPITSSTGDLVENFLGLPNVMITEIRFDKEIYEEDNTVRLQISLHNGEEDALLVRVKWNAPSFNQGKGQTDLIQVGPQKQLDEQILLGNVKNVGENEFDVWVCDKENRRLSKKSYLAEVKRSFKSKLKKVLEYAIKLRQLSPI